MTRKMDEGHTVDVMYLEFEKAFDSVNHRFLLAKMKSFGLGDVVVRWVQLMTSTTISLVQYVDVETLSARLASSCVMPEPEMWWP